jgi:DeoR/GlpR family transcriptional regulator of sugar metabolism
MDNPVVKIDQGRPVLVEDRRKRVLDLVKQRGFITLADLALEIRVSEATVRRDLTYWHLMGQLKRIHGGAMSLDNSAPLPALDSRMALQVTEKRKIARVAAGRIRSGDAILLDGGTTTLEVARCLIGKPVQIVTNSLPIANLFANSRETELVMLGGYVYPTTGVVLGPLTIQVLKTVQVQQAILSVAGITAKGLFNSNPLLVETERQMMRCADEVVVVADHTKVGRQALAFLCDLPTIDTLIVDSDLTPDQRALLEGGSTRLILAGKPTSDGATAKRTKP